MAYEAGTAVLEVVPSFRDIDKLLAKGARDIAKGLDKALGDQLGDAVDKAGARAEQTSERAGRKLGQVFADRALRQVEVALSNIPESDRVLKPLRRELEALAKVDLGKGFDEKGFIARVQRAFTALKRAQQDATGVNAVSRSVNAGNAAAALGLTLDIVDVARKRGFEAGDAFTNAYVSRLKSIDKLLPDLLLRKGSSGEQRELTAIKDRAADISRLRVGDRVTRDDNPLGLKVGVSISAQDLIGALETVEALLDQFSERAGTIELVVAADKARQQAAAFHEDIKTSAQKAAEEGAREQARVDEQNRKLRLAQLRKDTEDRARILRAEREQALREERKSVEDLADYRARVIEAELDERKRLLERNRKLSVDAQRRETEARAKALRAEREDYKREYELALQENRRRTEEQLRRTTVGQTQKAARQAAEAIQDVPFEFRTRDIDREMARIRERIIDLSNEEIKLTISSDDFAEKATREFVRLQQIAHDKDVDIQVRVDAAKAASELGAILLMMGRIDKDKATVKVDTSGALSGLGKLAGNLSLNLGRLGALIALGASLGTAIVPAAAAAASAIGAIGTAGLAGAAGLGVMFLGLSGIGEAVSAMGQLADDSEKSSASLARAGSQVAAASDQVKSAEMALANTRRNNQQAALRAARAIRDAVLDQRDAVRDVAEANRDAVERYREARRDATRADIAAARAQQDLADSYEAARRALRDLNSQVRGNALDQRQATLDVAEAKEELDKLLANPRATAAEREQAEITYQQRLLQMDDLKRKGDELTDEQEKRFAVGIKGSDQVKKAEQDAAEAQERNVKAQRAVKKAQQDIVTVRLQGQRKLADAQTRLADAQRAAADQQADAAYSMFTANQSLVAAQRSLREAYTRSGVAGGAALDRVKTVMGKLSPTAQKFAEYIFGLRDAFFALRRAADPMIAGLQGALDQLIGKTSDEAIKKLQPLFDFVGRVSEALGGIFLRFVDTLQGPTFTRFFQYISDTAVPMLEKMYTAFENVLVGVTNLFLAFTPLTDSVADGFVGLTETFRQWSEGLETNLGFQKFMDYLRASGPQMFRMLKAVGDAFVKLVIAAAPIGSFVVDAITKIAELIASIPQDVLNQIVIALAVGAAAIAAFAGASALAALEWAGLIGALLGLGVGIITFLYQRLDGARERMLAIFRVVGEALSALWTGVIKPVLGFLYQAFKFVFTEIAGPIVSGLIKRLTLGFRNFVVLFNRYLKPAIEELGTVLRAFYDHVVKPVLGLVAALLYTVWTNVIKPILAAWNGDTSELSESNKLFVGVLLFLLDKVAAAMKFLWNNVIKPYLGGWIQMMGVLAQVTTNTLGLIARFSGIGTIVGLINRFSGTEKDVDTSGYRVAGENAGRAALALGRYATAAANASTGSRRLTPSQQALADANKVLSDSTATAEQKMHALRDAQDAIRQSAIDAVEAEESWEASLDSLSTAVNRAKEADDKHATSLSTKTETGRANRDALEELIESANRMYDADVAMNGVTQEGIDKGKAHLEQVKKLARQLGLNEEQTEALITTYGKVPKNIETAVSMDPKSYQNVFNNLRRMVHMQDAANRGLSPEAAEAEWLRMEGSRLYQRYVPNRPGNIPGHADGGPIGGRGGKREDANLIWASRGEYMQQASAVDYYGVAFMEALNRRLIPKTWFQGLRDGGQVGRPKQRWPYVFNPTPKIPSMKEIFAEVVATTVGGVAGKWPPSPAAQRGDSGVWRTVLDIIRASGVHSGSFGNAFRPGDPKWHGSGRAIDWMGFNQDALARYLAKQRPLELIHRTKNRDYAYTRGRNMGSFNEALMEAHRNHIHVAFDNGGLLPDTRNMPGSVMQVFHGRRTPDKVLTDGQWQSMATLAQQARQSLRGGDTFNFPYRDSTLNKDELDRFFARRDALARTNRPNF